jgi:hypothetical protein
VDLLPVAFDTMRPEVVRTKDVEEGPALAVSWAAGLEESVGEEYVISVVDMNYMGRVATQLQIVEVAHFENLLAAGILEEGMIAAANTAGLVGIVID